ncbi:ribonuclease H-like domain-containing protein [Hypoxylon rubiginosum]|uniref:Ribonuclease H-like domain-containing protein n=1 Tax=Hypoxylon rubiginosum TaxID=110542 RepID=A0ACC0CN47_9PEZI|nr:ribonuclease H-like domain-containing protein [Hypoxylon rubiginosum]
MADGVWRPTTPFDKNVPRWPLSYSLTRPPTGPHEWNYMDFRGPEGQTVDVLFSDSFENSECIAKTFLDEPVLGFDMEWPMDADERTILKEKLGLIQISCENRIALFHISLHNGSTTQDLIAPSLRRIIESPAILKVGVGILSADFKKLKEDFELQPRGACELTHLHNLVRFGSNGLENVDTRLWALAKQVQVHLGLPLPKDPAVRESDWSKPLDNNQKKYAANDAYAGFMLFHCLNAKRLRMATIPPLPKLAESYLPFKFSKDIRAVEFEPGRLSQYISPTQELSQDITIASNRLLGDTVAARRLKLYSLRKSIGIAWGIGNFSVPSREVILRFSNRATISKRALLDIYEIGEEEAKRLSHEWLQIIESFEAGRVPESAVTSISGATRERLRGRLERLRRLHATHIIGPSQNSGMSS